MIEPRRHDSTPTLRIDREDLRRATESDATFEAWAAQEIARTITTDSVPPPRE